MYILSMSETVKKALISILVGATVAFVTTLLQGLLGWISTQSWDFSGSVAAVAWFLRINNRA